MNRFITNISILFLVVVVACNPQREKSFYDNQLENNKLLINNAIDLDNASLELLEKTAIVFLYPEGICDVCDTDIFNSIKKYKNHSFYKNIIVFIPVTNYRDLILYNKEYELAFENIVPYKNAILETDVQLSRATFALIKKNKIIASFTPDKPINQSKLDDFISQAQKKLVP